MCKYEETRKFGFFPWPKNCLMLHLRKNEIFEYFFNSVLLKVYIGLCVYVGQCVYVCVRVCVYECVKMRA